MFRILHLVTADFVRDGDHEFYQMPPYLEFDNRERAALFVRDHIFIYKLRGEWHGVLSKIARTSFREVAARELTKAGVWVPSHELEVVEVLCNTYC
jgi:hypothetical protein